MPPSWELQLCRNSSRKNQSLPNGLEWLQLARSLLPCGLSSSASSTPRPQPLSTHGLEGRKRRAPEKPVLGSGRSLPDKGLLFHAAPTLGELRVTAHVNRALAGVGLAKPEASRQRFRSLVSEGEHEGAMRPISPVASLQDAAEGAWRPREVKVPRKYCVIVAACP